MGVIYVKGMQLNQVKKLIPYLSILLINTFLLISVAPIMKVESETHSVIKCKNKCETKKQTDKSAKQSKKKDNCETCNPLLNCSCCNFVLTPNTVFESLGPFILKLKVVFNNSKPSSGYNSDNFRPPEII